MDKYRAVYVINGDSVVIAKAFSLKDIKKGKSEIFIIYFDTFYITMSYALAYELLERSPSVFIVDYFSKVRHGEIYYYIGCSISDGTISNNAMPLVTIHFYTNYSPSFVSFTTDYNYYICSENGQQAPARWSIGKKNDHHDDNDHFILSAELRLNHGANEYKIETKKTFDNYIVSNMFFAIKSCFGCT
jgi:hypothetical protein